MSAAKVMAKDVIASLKSGVLLKGIVRPHSTDGSMNIAGIAIELPVVGERQVLVKDEQLLELGAAGRHRVRSKARKTGTPYVPDTLSGLQAAPAVRGIVQGGRYAQLRLPAMVRELHRRGTDC